MVWKIHTCTHIHLYVKMTLDICCVSSDLLISDSMIQNHKSTEMRSVNWNECYECDVLIAAQTTSNFINVLLTLLLSV